MNKKITKNELVRYFFYHTNKDLGFIANCILTGCTESYKKLKKLYELDKSGHEISIYQFVMPYEGFMIDGRQVNTTTFMSIN